MSKVKLFTHTDLDGVGCAILAYLSFGKENVDVSYCNYDDINEKIEDFLLNGEHDNYNNVFITDISVNEKLAEMINNISDSTNENLWKFNLLDHHKTAEWLNGYEWVFVDSNIYEHSDYISKFNLGKCSSGTQMFYDWLNDRNHENVYEFVENVRQYDTWEWKNIYKSSEPKKMNDLMYIYGRELFIDNIMLKIKNKENMISIEDEMILLSNQEKIDKYIESCNKNMVTIKGSKYSYGFVFAEQYISELGNMLCELNNDVDFVAIVNMKLETISYRTIKDNVDVSEIAKLNGGGGHKSASGNKFDVMSIVNTISNSIKM